MDKTYNIWIPEKVRKELSKIKGINNLVITEEFPNEAPTIIGKVLSENEIKSIYNGKPYLKYYVNGKFIHGQINNLPSALL